jgi:hypothetical protein
MIMISDKQESQSTSQSPIKFGRECLLPNFYRNMLDVVGGQSAERE